MRTTGLERGARARTVEANDPDEIAFWADMSLLTGDPKFQRFLGWIEDRVDDVTIDPTDPNAGALLRVEGRRSLYRTIRGLRALADTRLKATNDGRGDHG